MTETGTLYLPPGIYRIDQPIQIDATFTMHDADGRPMIAYGPCSIQIIGDSPACGDFEQFHGSVLRANFTDAPAITIETARAVTIKNLVIRGQNQWTSQKWRDPTDALTHYDESNYLFTPTCYATPVRNDRHSPYAGIQIDPFDVGVPAGSRYPTLTSKYDAHGGGSVKVAIEGCHISGFVVGIGISLAGGLDGVNGTSVGMGNGEDISIVDCFIVSTKSAIAVGGTQTRNNSIRNTAVFGAKYAINCTEYGIGSGNCPSIFGANIGGVKYVFTTASWASTPSINGLYCESTLSIGQLGGGADGHVFNACTFSLMNTPPGKPALFRLRNLVPATFNGCNISVEDSGGEPLWFANLGRLSFNNCSFHRNFPPEYPSFYINGNNGWSDRVTFNESVSNTTYHHIAVTCPLSTVQPVEAFTSYENTYMVPGCLFYEMGKPGTSLRWLAGGFPLISLSAQVRLGAPDVPEITVTVGTHDVNDGTATFAVKDPHIVRVGDFIFSDAQHPLYSDPQSLNDAFADRKTTLVIGKVQSVDISPTTSYGTIKLVNVPEIVKGGALTSKLSVAHWPRVHMPSQGTIHPSNRQVEIQLNGGFNYWQVGDRILAEGDYIYEGTYITKVDSSTNPLHPTVTLSKQTKPNVPSNNGAGMKVRLYDADVREVMTTKL